MKQNRDFLRIGQMPSDKQRLKILILFHSNPILNPNFSLDPPQFYLNEVHELACH
jgi:hypothetical protein